MKFQVPQFIDTEDKIFGPLSFKEFSYIAGGCGLAYILYRFIPSFLIAIIFIAPVLTFAAMLAFYRPNNKPFIEMVQSAMLFSLGSKIYRWKREKKIVPINEMRSPSRNSASTDMALLSENKLSSINWNLDTQKGDKEKEI